MQDKKFGHLHMNPGAAGISGFHQARTMLRFSMFKFEGKAPTFFDSCRITEVCNAPDAGNEVLKTNPPNFICGHSHILKVMQDKKFGHLHMNPGAAGISGFHQVRTMLRFSIDSGRISELEVIEMGSRAR